MKSKAHRTDSENRLHRVISSDGTEIVARVEGQGPPVVLLPAGPGDSELSWRHVVQFLKDQCTCYMLETRGRGKSDDHPDHSPDRLVEDVLACIDSIDEPTGLVGWGSALWARVAAKNPASLVAVAVYEPGAGEVMNKESGKRMGEAFADVGELVGEGRYRDAVHRFMVDCDVIYSQDDIDSGAPAEFWETAAHRMPLFLQESKQASGSGALGPTSPEVLAKIEIPVFLMHGDRTSTWFSDSVKHVTKHIPNATTSQIPDAAHFGPLTHPPEVAQVMGDFFLRHFSKTATGDAEVVPE